MIEACEGSLGAGKTFYCVCRMAEQLGRGGMVFTNVDVAWDGMVELVKRRYRRVPVADQLVMIERDKVLDFDQHILWGTDEMPVLLVLDEIHLWFDQHQGKDFNKRLMAFLTQSRKADVNIIFISQDILNVAVNFRRMLIYVWRFRDMATWKLPLWGPLITSRILGVCLDRSGKTVMERVWMKKDALVFRAYRTKAILTGLEVPTKRAKVFKLEEVPLPSFWERTGVDRRGLAVAGWVAFLLFLFTLKITIWLNT